MPPNDVAAFHSGLLKLVQLSEDLYAQGPGKAKPEELTTERLVRPTLALLNYEPGKDLLPQTAIPKDVGTTGWVDFCLLGTDNRPLAFLDAKPLWDKDLWKLHSQQMRDYQKGYLLSLDNPNPVKWIILTNFREFCFVHMFDREPFLRLTFTDLATTAGARTLWDLMERSNLDKDLILAKYQEAGKRKLDEQFLTDLQQWRQIIVGGLRAADKEATLARLSEHSARLIDQVVFLRVLETQGLHTYYSLPKEWAHWRVAVRNKGQFAFCDEVERLLKDLELDLNTELLKLPDGLPAIGDQFLAACLIPDEPIHVSVVKACGVQPTFYPRTLYSYDFSKLTPDILGAVYERYLAHELVETKSGIEVQLNQNARQREGAYFTDPKVAQYLVQTSVGPLVDAAVDKALALLGNGAYGEAYEAISNDLANISVFDPACGSGIFLMQAFETLLAGYRRYNDRVAQIRTETAKGDLFAAPPELKAFSLPGEHIASSQIFGVDKDPQAVEVTRLNIWLSLLRRESASYSRSNGSPPSRKLPALDSNVVARDSAVPKWNYRSLIKGPGPLVVVGNPPWGAELASTEVLQAQGYTLATGQYDSYEIFLEAALSSLAARDRLAFLIPDSIFLSEHERTRSYLLERTAMQRITRLGEGLFSGVFRAATGLVVEVGKPGADHLVRCAVVTKAGRKLLKKDEAASLEEVESLTAHSIRQARFAANPGKEFDILITELDEPITTAMKDRAIHWEQATSDARGAEIGKEGLVVKCPYCGVWNNVPRKDKQGVYKEKKCSNPHCARTFEVGKSVPVRQVIFDVVPDKKATCKPLIVGEAVHRYQILAYRWIDTSKTTTVPICPACDWFDATWSADAEEWACKECKAVFSLPDVKDWARLGIRYKSEDIYKPPKLLVRKTGRGIYASIDQTDALTNQVVFIFHLVQDPNPAISLYYLLGVLNSRLMLYYYYKKTAEVEWRSFPYVTQAVIKTLPVRAPNLADPKERLLHDQIANLAERLVQRAAGEDLARADEECENLVRALYGIDPDQRAWVDKELDRISQLGTLLATPEGEEDEDEGGLA